MGTRFLAQLIFLITCTTNVITASELPCYATQIADIPDQLIVPRDAIDYQIAVDISEFATDCTNLMEFEVVTTLVGTPPSIPDVQLFDSSPGIIPSGVTIDMNGYTEKFAVCVVYKDAFKSYGCSAFFVEPKHDDVTPAPFCTTFPTSCWCPSDNCLDNFTSFCDKISYQPGNTSDMTWLLDGVNVITPKEYQFDAAWTLDPKMDFSCPANTYSLQWRNSAGSWLSTSPTKYSLNAATFILSVYLTPQDSGAGGTLEYRILESSRGHTADEITVTFENDCSTETGAELDRDHADTWIIGSDTAQNACWLEGTDVHTNRLAHLSVDGETFTFIPRTNAWCETNWPVTHPDTGFSTDISPSSTTPYVAYDETTEIFTATYSTLPDQTWKTNIITTTIGMENPAGLAFTSSFIINVIDCDYGGGLQPDIVHLMITSPQTYTFTANALYNGSAFHTTACPPELDVELTSSIGTNVISINPEPWQSQDTPGAGTHSMTIDTTYESNPAALQTIAGLYTGVRKQGIIEETFNLEMCYLAPFGSSLIDPSEVTSFNVDTTTTISGTPETYTVNIDHFEWAGNPPCLVTQGVTGMVYSTDPAITCPGTTCPSYTYNQDPVNTVEITVDIDNLPGDYVLTYNVAVAGSTPAYSQDYQITITLNKQLDNGPAPLHLLTLYANGGGTCLTCDPSWQRKAADIGDHYIVNQVIDKDPSSAIEYRVAEVYQESVLLASSYNNPPYSTFVTERELQVDFSSVTQLPLYKNTFLVNVWANYVSQPDFAVVYPINIFIFECQNQAVPTITPQFSSDIYLRVGEQLVMSRYSSADFTFADPTQEGFMCFPYTLKLLQQPGNVEIIDNSPTWVSSYSAGNDYDTQGTPPLNYHQFNSVFTTAAYWYDLTIESTLPETVTVSQEIKNNAGELLYASPASTSLFFYQISITTSIWVVEPCCIIANDVFRFPRQQFLLDGTTPAPQQIATTYTNYDQPNTSGDVTLRVEFVGRDLVNWATYFTVTSTGTTMSVEPNIASIPSQLNYAMWIDRNLIVDETSTLLASESSLFEFQLIDCVLLIGPPADPKISMQSSFNPDQYIATGAAPDEFKITFEVDDDYLLNLNTINNNFAGTCGVPEYSMTVDDSSKASFFDLTGSLLTIYAPAISSSFITLITFETQNDYHLFTHSVVTFNMMTCLELLSETPGSNYDIMPDGFDTTDGSTVGQDMFQDLEEGTDRTINWNKFKYQSSISCGIEAYEVTCSDPQGLAILVDKDGVISGDPNSKCHHFQYDTTPEGVGARSITIPSTIPGQDEGEYLFTVKGENFSVPSDDTMVLPTFSIFADCGDSGSFVYPPVGPITFQNTDISDPLGAKISQSDIHHYMWTVETFSVPHYTTEYSWTCAIHLEYILEDISGATVPSYISKVDQATHTDLVFAGSTNAQWTLAEQERTFRLVGRLQTEPHINTQNVVFEIYTFRNCNFDDFYGNPILTFIGDYSFTKEMFIAVSDDFQINMILQEDDGTGTGTMVDISEICTVVGDAYQLTQTNNFNPLLLPTDTYDTTILTFDQMTLGTLNFFDLVVKDENVKNYDSLEATDCNLGDPATTGCQIDFTIFAQTVNTTYSDPAGQIVDGSITWKSECWQLGPIYIDPSSVRADFWNWQTTAQDIFDEGYEVRNAVQTLELPQLTLALPTPGNGDVLTVCGDLLYTFESQDFYYKSDLSSETNILQNENPGFFTNFDQSAAIPTIDIQTENSYHASFLDPYEQEYQISLSAILVNYPSLVTYTYYDACDPTVESCDQVMLDRQAEMVLTVFDGCVAPIWDPPFIGHPLEPNYDLSVRIYVLAAPYELLYPKLGYSKTMTSPGNECGFVLYTNIRPNGIVVKLDASQVEIFVENEENFIFYLAADSESYFGEHILELRMQVQVISDRASTYGFPTYFETNEVHINVMPCKIESLTAFDLESFAINYDAALLPVFFDSFIMSPDCGYPFDYTLTIDEFLEGAAEEPFESLIEGSRPTPSIVTFFSTSRLGLWFCEDEDQIAASFYVYVKGTTFLPLTTINNLKSSGYDLLPELEPGEEYTFEDLDFGHPPPNVYLEMPKTQMLNTFTVSIDQPLYLLDNTPPMFITIPTLVELKQGQSSSYYLPEASDYENNKVYLESWSTSESISWVEVRNSTDGDSYSIEDVEFIFNPPARVTEDLTFDINIVIADTHATKPMSTKYSIPVILPLPVEFNIETITTTQETGIDLPPPVMTYEPIDAYDNLRVSFNDLVLYPSNITDFSSNNEGAEVFNLTYIPSSETIDYWYQAETTTTMSWKIAEATPTQLVIALNFTDENAVSTNSLKQDKVTIKLLQPELFIGANSQKPIVINVGSDNQFEQGGFQNFLNGAGKRSQGDEGFLAEAGKRFEDAVKTLMGANLFISIFMGGAIQLMWGMINALQMMVLTVLFSCYYPTNAEIIYVSILQLCNFDFFAVEDFMIETLSFNNGHSFSITFENAKMDGQNFVVGIGPIFFTMVMFPIYIIIHKVTRYVFEGQTDSKWLNKFIQKKKFKSTIIKFLQEGCLELGLTALVCIVSMNRAISFGTIQDSFSTLLAVGTLIAILIAPLFTAFQANRYHKHYFDEKIRLKYKSLFQGKNRRSVLALNYYTFFFLRRFTIMTAIIFTHYYRLIQINVQIGATYFFLLYIVDAKPFQLNSLNMQEILNEVTVLLTSYFLFCYTNWVSDFETRYSVGWVSISFVMINLFMNISFMTVVTCKKFIRKCQLRWMKTNHKKMVAEAQVQRELAARQAPLKQAAEQRKNQRLMKTLFGENDGVPNREILQKQDIILQDFSVASAPSLVHDEVNGLEELKQGSAAPSKANKRPSEYGDSYSPQTNQQHSTKSVPNKKSKSSKLIDSESRHSNHAPPHMMQDKHNPMMYYDPDLNPGGFNQDKSRRFAANEGRSMKDIQLQLLKQDFSFKTQQVAYQNVTSQIKAKSRHNLTKKKNILQKNNYVVSQDHVNPPNPPQIANQDLNSLLIYPI